MYPKWKLSSFQFNMSNLHKYKVSIHIIKSFWSSLFTHIWAFIALSSILYSRSVALCLSVRFCSMFTIHIINSMLDTIITFQNCYGDEIRFFFCLLRDEFFSSNKNHHTMLTQIYEKLEIEREELKLVYEINQLEWENIHQISYLWLLLYTIYE